MESTGFRLKLYFMLLVVVMGLGTVAFSLIEKVPLLDALYFSVVTVATVGYGDIHPTTAMGKILSIALIIAGVGTFLEVIAGITQVMLRRRDKELRMEKLNMIVGLFFSELGVRLLKLLSASDPDIDALRENLTVSGEWTPGNLEAPVARSSSHPFKIDEDRMNLQAVRELLESKGNLLLRLLENPTLLEQETFTELLRAIFHLRDELMNRDQLAALPDTDKKHLTGDMQRVYRLLANHWRVYMSYLQKHYPYLFSLAMRTNPFDRHASAVVRE